MRNALLFDFSVDKEKNTILIKREFAADRPLVWDAFTKSEILDQWWAPEPWKVRTETMDFREGGYWHYAMMGPEGEQHWARMDYHTITRPEMFSGLDAFAFEDGSVNTGMPQSKWEMTFTEKGDVTLVESYITYNDLAQLEAGLAMGFKEGLTASMEALDVLLVSLKK